MSQCPMNVTNVQDILVHVPLSAGLSHSHTQMGQDRLPWSQLGLYMDEGKGRLLWLLLGSLLGGGKAGSLSLCWTLLSLRWGQRSSPGHCWALSHSDGGKADSPGHCWALSCGWARQAPPVTAGLSVTQMGQGRLPWLLLGSFTWIGARAGSPGHC